MTGKPAHAIGIDASGPARGTVAQLLAQGRVIILRNVAAIRQFRAAVEDYVRLQDPASASDLAAFYAGGTPPSVATALALSNAIKTVRTDRFLSRCLAPFIAELGFGAPVRLDGGLSRLAVPSGMMAAARQSGLFAADDFKRQTDDGPTEIFLPAPGNIHRDYNRQHYLLQCNLWFPLHDAGEDEVLRIFPDLYRQPVFDMEPTEENMLSLGEPLRYRLAFGDAILFHGEHLHTSPRPGPRVQRRHSYDFRIASFCFDDTRHYRDVFLDLRNFPEQREAEVRLGNYRPASTADVCALPALLELERSSALDEAALAHFNDLFDSFAFAEDRYLLLAARAVSAQAPVGAARALRTIADRSPNWFWLAMAGQGLRALGDRARAAAAFRKAHDLAGQKDILRNFMPVAYTQPPTQPLPQAVQQFCEQALAAIGAEGSRVA